MIRGKCMGGECGDADMNLGLLEGCEVLHERRCCARVAVVLAGCFIGGLPLAADELAYPDAFEVCTSCHAYEENEPPLVGPPLWGVVGRPVASVDGYQYSAALQSLGGNWEPARLDVFLTRPAAFAPGTRMDMGGIADATARAEVLEFLQSLQPGKPAGDGGGG